MPTQLERELSMVPNCFKKARSRLADSSGLADRGDLVNEDVCDPVKEKKILDKIVALKKRLVFWTKKMAESVHLKINYFLICSGFLILISPSFQNVISFLIQE